MLTPITTEAMATMQIPGLPQRLHQVGLEWGPEPCMAASTPHDSHMNGKEREKKKSLRTIGLNCVTNYISV